MYDVIINGILSYRVIHRARQAGRHSSVLLGRKKKKKNSGEAGRLSADSFKLFPFFLFFLHPTSALILSRSENKVC